MTCATNNGGCGDPGLFTRPNNPGGPPTCADKSDAGQSAAGQPDAGPRGATCPAIATSDASVFTSFTADPGFACAFPGSQEFTTWSSALVALIGPTQVTICHGHSLLSVVRAVGIADDCASVAPTCQGSVSYPSVLSRGLDAGVYEFEARGPGQHLVFEPLSAVANSVNCAGSSALGYQPRVVDGQPRFYTYTANSTRTVNVVFWGTMQIGKVNVERSNPMRGLCIDNRELGRR